MHAADEHRAYRVDTHTKVIGRFFWSQFAEVHKFDCGAGACRQGGDRAMNRRVLASHFQLLVGERSVVWYVVEVQNVSCLP